MGYNLVKLIEWELSILEQTITESGVLRAYNP